MNNNDPYCVSVERALSHLAEAIDTEAKEFDDTTPINAYMLGALIAIGDFLPTPRSDKPQEVCEDLPTPHTTLDHVVMAMHILENVCDPKTGFFPEEDGAHIVQVTSVYDAICIMKGTRILQRLVKTWLQMAGRQHG